MKRVNPLKLNKLQLRTLVLTQIIARSQPDESWNKDGSVTILRLPHAHGDHVHVGEFVVNAAEITGFNNRAVWTALARKGLVADKTIPPIVLTREGLDYDTGLGHHFLQKSDH
ncbi:hypothetical protein SAMN04515647_3119 [Cohaesibacter sp. ES.047]|uniref:hypothetical protein n=1 Tax=Cohaesibacter sp. ES.047 TaxID=1798205 RepID=UPI000BB8CBE3|nr:hypothetical protein [Cohaesibacter sp. ES.047]SNY92853.1 hypothetical protein SAMN04515647_3119 [Cohaesibacter sp. ES.047]